MNAPKINFSGFLSQSVLFSLEDLKQLFVLLQPFKFFNTSSIQTESDELITQESFFKFYTQFLHYLFLDQDIDEKEITKIFHCALATDQSSFYKQTFSQDRFLLKPIRPVIQLQPLGLFISSIDKTLHSKTFSKDAQPFGLKISFPTIFEDCQSHLIQELKPDDKEYEKFAAIRQFVRHQTKPLILSSNQEKKVYPIRYSENLKQEITKMKFFQKHELFVVV